MFKTFFSVNVCRVNIYLSFCANLWPEGEVVQKHRRQPEKVASEHLLATENFRGQRIR